MKRTEIKILSLIVSAIFSAVIVPAGLSAQEGGVEGLHTNKNSTYDNSTHQGKITLETFVEGEVKVKTQSSPCDIVMVLDFSESMKANLDLLKESCKTFLSEIKKNNVNHRVAIVSYATYKSMSVGGINLDCTIVWPQNSEKTSLKNLNPYGESGAENSNTHLVNTDSAISSYVRNTNKSFFIPVGAEVEGKGNVLEFIIDHFSTSDMGKLPDMDYGTDGNSFRGLQIARELLTTKRSDNEKKYQKEDGSYASKPTYVVLFTDDTPGFEQKSSSFEFSDDNLSIVYALNAIGESNKLKKDGTVVFTVGLNKVCDTSFNSELGDYATYGNGNYYFKKPENAFNVFLSILSSNYKGKFTDLYLRSDIEKNEIIGSMGNQHRYYQFIEERFEIWKNRNTSSDFSFDIPHYMSSKDSSGMKKAFETISEMIIAELPSMPLSSETVLKDYINKAFFKLPKDATVNDIVVYTRPFSGMSGSDFVFGTDKTPLTVLDRPLEESEIGSCVRVIIDWAEDGVDNSQDCVSVTGFDYAANWVGLDVNKNPHGCELVVEIPFVFKDGVELDGDLDTNTGDSGIYTPDNPDEPVEPYPVPTLSFKDLTITRSDLESGESAIYNVYSVNQDNKLVYTVVLTGTSADGSNSASKTISGVLARDSEGNYYGYKVTESDWDWAYNKDADNNSKTSTFEGSSQLEFEFAGAHKDKKNTTDPAYKQSHTEVKKSDRISKTN